jgi:hypothetical protein
VYPINSVQLDMVDMAVSAKSRKKRNLLTLLLFIGFLGCSLLGLLIFQNKIVSLILIVPVMVVSYLISKKSRTLIRIGSVTMDEEKIHLVNETDQQERMIELKEVTKIFIRGGVRLSGDSAQKKSLFIDITLDSGEEVIVHVAVIKLDEHTAEQITAFCKTHNIVCYRKL